MHRLNDAILHAVVHPGMEWKGEDLTAVAFRIGEIVAAAVGKQREPMPRLPMYAVVDAAVRQMLAQLLPAAAQNANVIDKRHGVRENCPRGDYTLYVPQVLVIPGKAPTACFCDLIKFR